MKIAGDIMVTRDFATMMRCATQRDRFGNLQNIVVFLQEDGYLDPRIANQIKAVTGSCLLPNPMAFQAFINSGLSEFVGEYVKYLNSNNPVEFMNILIRQLCETEGQPAGNIILFLTGEQPEQENNYMSVLVEYIQKEYGISVGGLDPSIPLPPQCALNPSYIPKLAQSMYLYNLCGAEDMMTMMPTGVGFIEPVVNKFYNEYKDKLKGGNFQEVAQEMYNIKEGIINPQPDIPTLNGKPLLFERI